MKLTENRRIFWNIVFTYGHSLLSMIGALFISRWVLMALGQVDYGLFSVIGGLVIFIQFFNDILATSTARFYAFSIGVAKTNYSTYGLEECRKWFNTALVIHAILPFLLIIMGYPIAKWAIYNWLTIPPDRMEACVWVLRFTCVSAFVAMINVPFTAMYTAKQYIAELTVYSMVTSILNIFFSYFMVTHPGQWLTKYALWMCAMSVLPQIIICIRANWIFEECKMMYSYMFNWSYLKQIASYAGWQFFGSFCWLLRGQGITVLINKILGPRLNASMQIARQVDTGTSTLSSALIKGFVPAIITACGAKDYTRMITLTFGACKFSTLLALIFVLPLALELPQIIQLWLKNPPEFTVGLCYLMLTVYICDVCTIGDMIVVNASGKVREYQLTLSGISIFTLPACIACLHLGFSVYSIGWVLVVATIINSAGRIYFAQKTLNISAVRWVHEVMMPTLGLSLITLGVGWLPHLFMPQSFLRLLVTTILSGIVMIPLAWFLIFNLSERQFIFTKAKVLYHRFCN